MKKGLREFLWVAFPKASGAAIQLGLNLLLVRYFGPAQFGTLAVCLTIITLSDAVLGSAFDVAVLRHAPLHHATDPVRSLQFQQSGLLLKPLFGLLVGLPLALFANRISALLFHTSAATDLLYVTMAAVFGLLLLRSVQAHFQVAAKFRGYGLVDIGHNTIRYGGTGLLLYLHSASPMRVVSLYALAPCLISMILLVTLARPLLTAKLSGDALRTVVHLVASYLPTAAIGSVTSRMDVFFVSSLGGVAQAGIFAAAQTLILAPQLVGMYIGVVFAPRIMPLYQEGRLAPAYNRFQRYAFWICCSAFVLGVVTMNRFVVTVLPGSFRNAAPVALLLLPAGLVALLNFPWTVSFLMFMRPQFLLKYDLVGLPILAVLYRFVIPSYGPMGAAAVTTAYALIKTVVMQKFAQHILKQGPLKEAQTAAAPELQLAGKVS